MRCIDIFFGRRSLEISPRTEWSTSHNTRLPGGYLHSHQAEPSSSPPPWQRTSSSPNSASLEQNYPDFSRLNPGPRLSQLPRQNISSAVQGLVLLPLFLYTVYLVLSPRIGEFLSLPLASVESGARHVGLVMEDLLQKAALAFLALGCIDLYRQKKRYNSELRMSKQEVRDEHKEAKAIRR